MLRKKFLLPCLIVAALLGTGIYIYLDQKITKVVWEADYPQFDSTEALIQASDFIFSGTPLASGNYVTKTKEGYLDESFTITEFKISKVDKKLASSNIKEGQVIKVVEPTWVVDKAGIEPGKTKISREGYEQMNTKSQYSLFLRLNQKGDMYVIRGGYQGKYNLDDTDNIESRNIENKERFNKIKNNVIALYKK